MEMPPVSKVTPLPTSPRWSRGGGLFRFVLHDNQRGGLGASLRHAEQRAHSELPHSVLIEDFKGETVGLGHPARAFGERRAG